MSGNAENKKKNAAAERAGKESGVKAGNAKHNAGNTLIKDTIIITVITLVAGLVLGFVYELTKDPIRIQKEQKQADACAEVFKEADENGELKEVLPLTFELLKDIDPDDAANIATAEESGVKDAIVDEVYAAKKADGSLYGYVLSVFTTAGYGGGIRFYMGVTTDGVLKGISILEISETPGLGMRASEVLVPQFRNVTGPVFTVTKNGKTNESEIDAITSATITSKAVTNAVNYGMKYFEEITKGGEE